MIEKYSAIKDLLLKKSATKQLVYRNTKEVFGQLKEIVKKVSNSLGGEIYAIEPTVEVKSYDKSELEIHLKFSGDTLVFMMHTNVFDFDPNHFIQKTEYIKEDPMREFCGMIQIYNFLADTIKYNREGDVGYLVGRLFINKEKHFFFEGKRPLSFLYSNISGTPIDEEALEKMVLEAMQYCLNFDLLAPPIENMSFITLEQKNIMSHSSGMPTGKRLGFRYQAENDQEA